MFRSIPIINKPNLTVYEQSPRTSSVSSRSDSSVEPFTLVNSREENKKNLGVILKVSKGKDTDVSLPPMIELTPKVRNHVYRFVNSSASQVNVNPNQIFGALGGICTIVNSQHTSWSSAFRIKSVRIWPAAGGSAHIAWGYGSSGYTPDSQMDESLPTGITSTKCLTFVPPSGSLAAFWQTTLNDSTIMSIKATVGSILDLAVEYCLNNQLEQTLTTIATGSVNTTYYLALDGPSSNKYVPVGLPTTS